MYRKKGIYRKTTIFQMHKTRNAHKRPYTTVNKYIDQLASNIICLCCLPTPLTIASGSPACFSIHLASSSITAARSVRKSRGDNVVQCACMCFRCLMFNLSGPCDCCFTLFYIASWTQVVVSVTLYPCIL